jgi:tetratricopeptide (TPR) repeat protein
MIRELRKGDIKMRNKATFTTNGYLNKANKETSSTPDLEPLEALGLERACRAVQDALTKNPFNQALHYEKARILERMGRHEEALRSARRAFFLDPIEQQVETYMHDLETRI